MNMMKKAEFSDDWLTGLRRVVSDPTLYALLKNCPLEIMQRWAFEDIPRGAAICRQGDICQRFSLIVAGEVDVFFEADDGRRYRQARYGKGDMLGELEIFDSRNYICSVVAVSNTQLLSLSQAHFERWLTLDNHFNQRMLRFFSQQYYQLSKKASSDSLYSLHQRVCQALWLRYEQQGTATFLLDKQNLSQEFAATTRSINRILHDLKTLRIIDSDGERIVLLAPEKLKQEAET
ncbi:Crp/Fnr family transcriptional regulator [[Enterobacter] lignolyticus]|uniref:Transcriptional regulator, Crp/Fnr family n=1 Tax=Enterobacter lignolyticus (strain SCF1) TaxID=701347 RepID=E3G404_ENTLS|nr:Crp/Fnr family transcriptional regulator [[Enterobacter] lignolyticus]ADO50486.1 transcriptional regulator, Crp/Fnr family [[Enterobacter] lignolyticus SCF1]